MLLMMLHLHLFIMTCLFAYGNTKPTEVTTSDYKYEVFKTGKTLTEAIEACKEKGAWLVEIKYKEINDTVESIITHPVLIGGKYGSAWKWNDGSLMRYTNWKKKQPSATGKGDCVIMDYQNGNRWTYSECGENDKQYVCQSDPTFGGICTDEICKSRGKCNVTEQRYNCACDDGYFGTKCEKRIIELSGINSKYNVNRGNSFTMSFTIVSYDGNVDVEKGSNILASTSKITSSRVTEEVTITLGSFNSADESITCTIRAVSKTNKEKSFDKDIIVNVQDHCSSNPCTYGLCNYIPSSPFYRCSCTPSFNGPTCTEPIYRHVNNCKYHINFDQTKKFDEASLICQNIDGSLAMMKTSAIQDAVEEQVIAQYGTGNITIAFWIGGTNKTNSWKWLDNTEIPLTGSNAKWAWTNAYAKNTYKDYLVLSSFGDSTRKRMRWFSKPSGTYGYVCEVPKTSPCESLECNNGGSCVAVGCQASCNCAPGFYGKNCEKDFFTITALTDNFISTFGQNITVTLNITVFFDASGHDDPVKIEVFKNIVTSNMISTENNTRDVVNISIGPFVEQSFGTIYVFRATPQSDPGRFYKYASIHVVVEGPAKIKSIAPRILAVPNKDEYSGIKCVAVGVPLPKVQWYKDKNLVTNNLTENIYQNASFGTAFLYVKNESRTNFGHYTCHSYNLVSGNKMSSNDTAYLRGKIRLASLTVNTYPTNGSATIQCIYEGYPVPNIEWRLVQKGNAMKLAHNEIFSIKFFGKEANGFVNKTSNLNIRLAEYLGSTEFECIGSNTYENETRSIKMNQNIVLDRNRVFGFFNFGKIGNYTQAQNHCRNIQSNLAKITDNKTQTILADAATKHETGTRDKIYIGAEKHREDGSSIWRWHDHDFLYNETRNNSWNGISESTVDGSYVAWRTSSPNNDGECLTMENPNWQWNDNNCLSVDNFICEKMVAGIPKIFVSTVDECSSNITIIWMLTPETTGITHRVNVVQLDENLTSVFSENTTSKNESEIIERKIVNLSRWTSYNVTITVCPDLCPHPATLTKTLTTHAGIPNAVSSANVTQINTTCIITWKMDTVPGISGFMIKTTGTVIHDEFGRYFGKFFKEIRSVTNETNQHDFEYNYNRNYTFSIQALTCAGAGPSREVIGYCVTKTGPPDEVLSPTVATQPNPDDTVNIIIPFPDEMNGPISCLFVIVVFMPNQSTVESITNYQGLETAMARNYSTILDENDAFIAIAISRSDIAEEILENSNFTKKLGDGSSSACNLTRSQKTLRRKREILQITSIEATNRKLENDATYSYYMLTTTPGDDGNMYYQASNISYFKKMKYENGKNSPVQASSTALVIVIVILVILAVAFAAFIWFKFRKTEKVEINALPMTETITQPDIDEEPEYANLTMDFDIKSETDIPLGQLLEVYNSLRANGSAKFYDQFEKLKQTASKLDYPTQVASAETLRRKNRYRNILPSDHTRVKLQGEEDASYINACYINGFGKARKYIATQGPVPSTVVDFWRMIFEQKVKVITMLAKCKENGKRKCEKYWPDLGFSKQYGYITVINAEEVTFGSFQLRTFRMNKDKDESTVYQMQFLDWPDHGVPVTTTSLKGFCAAVEKQQSSGPIVVHCSAGAGRTGTFIAYHNLIAESESSNSIDAYRCVMALRKQRVDMVQTCEQYMLVHKLILEHYLYGVTDMDPVEVKNMDEKSLNEKLQKQFQNLSIIGPINQIKHGIGEKISAMNRNSNIFPYENNHVVITIQQEDVEPPYINASTIETYCNAFKMIAAQGPMKNTVEIFWRAIIDNNVNTIIMLSKCSKGQCSQYWPEKELTDIKLGNIAIHLRREDIDGSITRREILVKRKDDEITVIQFQYDEWSSNECPKSASVIIEMIAKMESSLQRDKDASAIVHCSDGAGRTGAFCTIVNLVERLKRESKIDIFHAVKDLRDCRPGMVQTLDQFKFCFKAISEYLTMFSPYAKIDENGEDQSEENPYVIV